MAGLAALAEVGLVHRLVTTDAGAPTRGRVQVAAIVTLGAAGSGMAVGQAEPGMRVAGQRKLLPVGDAVAIFAAAAQLAAMRILMTTRAARELEALVLGRATLVAILALHGRVRAAQRVAGRVVVELLE